jgi:hypothetical protein
MGDPMLSCGKLVMCNPKNDGTIFITGMNVFVAFNVECMIKETYGHALIPFLFLGFVTLERITHVLFFNDKYASF